MIVKDYISVKEFAQRTGVSKQAIYQQLNKRLKDYVRVFDGKKCIEESALELFLQNDENTKKQSSDKSIEREKDSIESEADKENSIENELIEMLKKQLEEKDKQIADLNKALIQQQQLHAMDKQRILELEDKRSIPEKKWWQIWK